MVSHLLDFVANVAQQTEHDNTLEKSLKPRWSLLTASFQFCVFLGWLTLAADPTVLATAITRSFSISLAVGSTCIGALVLILVRHITLGEKGRLRVLGVFFAETIAALAFLVALSAPALGNVALIVSLVAIGAAIPFAVLSYAVLFSSLSCGDILLNSALDFLVFDLFFAIIRLWPEAIVPALTTCLILGAVATATQPTRLSFPRQARCGLSFDRDDPDTNSKDADIIKLKTLLFSVSYLGLLLFMFTSGVVTRGSDSTASVLFATFVSLALIGSAVIFFVQSYRTKTLSQCFFLIFDIGLPGLAAVALVIKVIPLELVSGTAFLWFMKMYFMVLIAAFWVRLMLFASATPRLLPITCGLGCMGCAVFFALGALTMMTTSRTSSIALGLITALFLLLAIVAAGHSLVLYAKGPEPEENLPSTTSHLADVCASIGNEYQLTPRELEVLKELAYGHSSSYIAKALVISSNTARSHMKNIYKKLGVGSREELIEMLREKQGGA